MILWRIIKRTKEIGSVIQAVEDLNNQLTLINNTISDDKNPVAYGMSIDYKI